MNKPLEGIRILDLTHWWSGPEATTVLAALGADVIKIEGTKRPDSSRALFLVDMTNPHWYERSPTFNGANAGKRGIAIDLAKPEGKALFKQMLEDADVVINNFSARVMNNLGLAHADLAKVKPDIVSVDMTSFGLTGPWAELVGFANVFEQLSGAADTTGFEDGPPETIGGASDPSAGYVGALAVLLGLQLRDATGEAQHFDISQTEAFAALLGPEMIEAQVTGQPTPRHGNRHPTFAPHNVYRCAGDDEWVALAVRNDAEWQSLVALLGSPAWATAPALATAAGRKEHEREIDRHMEEWTSTQDKKAVADRLWAAGLPSGELTAGFETEDDAQFKARGVFQHFDRDPIGPINLPVVPFRMSGLDLQHTRPAPRFGGHTDEVLKELLGLSDEKLAELHASGVIASEFIQ